MRGPHFHLFDDAEDEPLDEAMDEPINARQLIIAAVVVFILLLALWVALVIWCGSRV